MYTLESDTPQQRECFAAPTFNRVCLSSLPSSMLANRQMVIFKMALLTSAAAQSTSASKRTLSANRELIESDFPHRWNSRVVEVCVVG